MAQQQRQQNRPRYLVVKDSLWGPIIQVSPTECEREVISFVFEGNFPATGATYQYFVGVDPAQGQGSSGMVKIKGEAKAKLRLSGKEVTVSIKVTAASGTTRVFDLDTFSLPQAKRKLVFLRGFERLDDKYEIFLRPFGKDGKFEPLSVEYWDFDVSDNWDHFQVDSDPTKQVIRVVLPRFKTDRTATFTLCNDAEVKIDVPIPAKERAVQSQSYKLGIENLLDGIQKGRNAYKSDAAVKKGIALSIEEEV